MHRVTSLPLLLGGATPALADRNFLAANGVRIALQGHHPFYASIKAVYDTLKHLKEGGAPADLRRQSATGRPAQRCTAAKRTTPVGSRNICAK